MGKYDLTSENDINNMEWEKLWTLNAIANELAEANRLKRLELQMKLMPSIDHKLNPLEAGARSELLEKVQEDCA